MNVITMETVRKNFAIITESGKKVELEFEINTKTGEASLMGIRLDEPLDKKETEAVFEIIRRIEKGYEKLAKR